MRAETMPRPLRIAQIALIALSGGVLVVAVAVAAWLGVRGAMAYGELRDAEAAARTAVDALADPAQAAPLIDEFAGHAASARDLTSDPIWRAAEAAPWVGPQLQALSTISAAADDVASDALLPLAGAASAFTADAFRPVDGRIDTAVFSEIAEPARAGADTVAAAAASVDALDDSALLGVVRGAVGEVSELLNTSATATDALARAAQLMPAMLGAEGERNYLIAFQNNAEWRSLGGIVGAMAVVRTTDGRIELTAQGSSSDFENFGEPVLPLAPDVEGIFETRPARYIQNVTQVPDFTVGGPLAREMWARQTGQSVDGVIATDPVALSYMLEATGPIQLPTGDTLTAENAVQLLLNDVYLRYERPADQDAFFAAAAASVFTEIAGGDLDPAALIAALGRAGDERRLLVWSAHEDDQQVLADTTLAGRLPASTDDTARLGVYLNDGTGSKMDYYVTADTQLAWTDCVADEAGRTVSPLTLTVTITNNAPADAATSLPPYITGGGGFGVPAGVARTVAYIYLPEGYALTSSTRSDGQGFGGGEHDGRQVMIFGSDLAPGASATAEIGLVSPQPGAGEAIVDITPTVDADRPTSVVARCGAA